MHTKEYKCETRNAEKKDIFARHVFEGMNKAEAYRVAFNRPDMSSAAARRAANRLTHDDYVQARLRELAAQLDLSVVLSKQERMEMLSEAARKCSRAEDVRGLVACVAELNKMDGAYAPAKMEVAGDVVKDFVRAQIERASAEPLVKGKMEAA